MRNGSSSKESGSLHLQPQQPLTSEGSISDRNGNSSSDGLRFSYRLRVSGGGSISPSSPTSKPERDKLHALSTCSSSSDLRFASPCNGLFGGGHRRRNYNISNGGARCCWEDRNDRSHSCRVHVGDKERELYSTKGMGVSVRSASTPVMSPGLPCSSHGSRTQATLHVSGATSSLNSNGVKSSAEIPMLLATGLSERQVERIHTCLQSGSSSKNAAKIKVLEFLEYWMSESATSTVIRLMIAETFRDAGFEDWNTVMPGGATDDGNGAQNLRTSSVGAELLMRKDEDGLGSPGGRSSSSSSLWSSLSVDDVELYSGCGIKSSPRRKHTQKEEGGTGEHVVKKNVEDHMLFAGAQFPDVKQVPVTTSSHTPVSPNTTAIQTVSPKRIVTFETPKPVPAAATYKDIPRFYYTQGTPQTAEETLIGPTKGSHGNPHLKLEKEIMIPTALCPTNTIKDSAPVISTSLQVGSRTKTAVFTPLKALEEKDVFQYIQKEFSRLSTLLQPSQNARCMSSNGKGFQARQEWDYNQQLTYSMQLICTQCFGLPKYFAFLILMLLQRDSERRGVDMMSMRRSSSVASSASSLVEPSSLSQLQSTLQQLWEFFETRLSGHSIIRRVFEMLVLSSRGFTHNLETSVGSGRCWKEGVNPGTQRHLCLFPEDFHPYIEVLLEHHPGLAFLKPTPDFQKRYMETVIYRIFYDLDRFDRGYITYAELESSCFMDALRQVDATEDINSVLLYFSYEHFYVLYCRFWELDEDRDMLLSLKDFMKYAPADVMNLIIAKRIFKGIGRRITCTVKNRINYEDFVWFCLSEEDKTTFTAIRYWFRILDVDGDGVLSVYELEKFFETMRGKINIHVPDGCAKFSDIICQIFDMLNVDMSFGIRLHDLVSKPDAAGVILDMVTNVVRFLQFEQKDPLVAYQDRLHGGLEQTPWARFARAEYDRMSRDVLNERHRGLS